MGQLTDGRCTVTTAGTRVPLSARSAAGGTVTLTALTGNTGAVVVGARTVVAAAATRRGVPLFASPGSGPAIVTLRVDDLSALYVDAERDGDGVSYVVS